MRKTKKRLNKRSAKSRFARGAEIIMTEEEIYTNLNENDHEICGYMNSDLKYVFTSVGEISNGRNLCKYSGDSTILWHTHPASGKYHPSVEDLVKVLKDSVSMSEIFTVFGKWTIVCTDPGASRTERDMVGDEVRPFCNKFYRNSGSARVNNPVAIQTLIVEVNDTMTNYFPTFLLEWEPIV